MKKNKIRILVNSMTILRIVGIPFFWYLNSVQSFILLNIMFISDFLDGYLSRKYKVTSVTGAALDLVADKVLTIFLLILYLIKGKLMFWLVFLLVVRELYSIGIRVYYLNRKLIKASKLGKLKTALFFIGFDLMILDIYGYKLLFIIIAVISYISLLGYVKKGINE